jgi:hypothetical protein
MARGGARPGAGRPAGKSANTSPPSARARARAREAAGNQRPWPADKVERWVIDRLIPYAKNARTHTDAQVAAIAASIKEWGCGGSSEAAELRREGTNAKVRRSRVRSACRLVGPGRHRNRYHSDMPTAAIQSARSSRRALRLRWRQHDRLLLRHPQHLPRGASHHPIGLRRAGKPRHVFALRDAQNREQPALVGAVGLAGRRQRQLPEFPLSQAT